MMTTLTCCRRSFAALWRPPVPAGEGRHDQLLTALRALLLSRKNPFGDIKLDGTVQKALENLGLGEAAKRNVGTGRIRYLIWVVLCFLLQFWISKIAIRFNYSMGPIDVPLTSQDTVTYFPIAFRIDVCGYLRLRITLPAVQMLAITVPVITEDPVKFDFQSRRTRYRCFIFRIRVLISLTLWSENEFYIFRDYKLFLSLGDEEDYTSWLMAR